MTLALYAVGRWGPHHGRHVGSATTMRRDTMQGELVECWLCEAAIVPNGALIRYRDEQGRVHPWADRRGRWQPEYICRACMLVSPDCTEYDWSGVGCWPASLSDAARSGRAT